MKRNVIPPIYRFTLSLCLLGPAAVLAQEVSKTSFVAPSGVTVQRHEIVVPAPVEEVWKAFTTRQGMESWMVPRAEIDLALGGVLETSYNPNAKMGDPANIRHEILSYLPLRMLSTRVIQFPPDFPHAEIAKEMWGVFELEPAGEGKTRVSVAGVGYLDGEAYDAMARQFDQGNTWTLMQLYKRFTEGPVDWNRLLGGAARTDTKDP